MNNDRPTIYKYFMLYWLGLFAMHIHATAKPSDKPSTPPPTFEELITGGYACTYNGSQGQAVVLVVGPTGSEKSTMINCLLGKHYLLERRKRTNSDLPFEMGDSDGSGDNDEAEGKEPDEDYQITLKPEGPQTSLNLPRIGLSDKSQTTLPRLPNIPYIYCDTPGYFDNREEIKKEMNDFAVALPKILSIKAPIKAMLVVLEQKIIEATKGDSQLQDVSQIIGTYIQELAEGGLELNTIKTNLCLLINKCPNKKRFKKIKKDFLEATHSMVLAYKKLMQQPIQPSMKQMKAAEQRYLFAAMFFKNAGDFLLDTKDQIILKADTHNIIFAEPFSKACKDEVESLLSKMPGLCKQPIGKFAPNSPVTQCLLALSEKKQKHIAAHERLRSDVDHTDATYQRQQRTKRMKDKKGLPRCSFVWCGDMEVGKSTLIAYMLGSRFKAHGRRLQPLPQNKADQQRQALFKETTTMAAYQAGKAFVYWDTCRLRKIEDKPVRSKTIHTRMDRIFATIANQQQAEHTILKGMGMVLEAKGIKNMRTNLVVQSVASYLMQLYSKQIALIKKSILLYITKLNSKTLDTCKTSLLQALQRCLALDPNTPKGKEMAFWAHLFLKKQDAKWVLDTNICYVTSLAQYDVKKQVEHFLRNDPAANLDMLVRIKEKQQAIATKKKAIERLQRSTTPCLVYEKTFGNAIFAAEETNTAVAVAVGGAAVGGLGAVAVGAAMATGVGAIVVGGVAAIALFGSMFPYTYQDRFENKDSIKKIAIKLKAGNFKSDPKTVSFGSEKEESTQAYTYKNPSYKKHSFTFKAKGRWGDKGCQIKCYAEERDLRATKKSLQEHTKSIEQCKQQIEDLHRVQQNKAATYQKLIQQKKALWQHAQEGVQAKTRYCFVHPFRDAYLGYIQHSVHPLLEKACTGSILDCMLQYALSKSYQYDTNDIAACNDERLKCSMLFDLGEIVQQEGDKGHRHTLLQCAKTWQPWLHTMQTDLNLYAD